MHALLKLPLFEHEIPHISVMRDFMFKYCSQHEMILMGEDRTNNYARLHIGHCIVFCSVYLGNHSHLWSFIQLLKSAQNSRDLSTKHNASGIKPARKQLNYKLADDRIHRLVSNLNEYQQHNSIFENDTN